MISEVISLVSYGYYGGAIGDVLNQWYYMGFFSYLLPFLLIFALVFGILSRMQLFGEGNKAIDGIIALVVGLMALQFDLVPAFFATIFPRLGVGLAILLVVLILAGFFIDPKKGLFRWILIGIGTIIALVVLINSAGYVGWYSGAWWYANWPMIAGVAIIIVAIAVIVGGANPDREPWGWWPMPGGPAGNRRRRGS